MTALMTGKAGLVTGAASGIGRGSAIELAAEGASVVVADLERSREQGEATVRTIRDAGGTAVFVATDVREEAQHRALVDAVLNEFGALDFAVNNAGVLPPHPSPMAELPIDEYDFVHQVNLRGLYLALHVQLQQMAKQSHGAIVNIASVAGLRAIPTMSSYVASKHGAVGLTKSASLEYGPQGIRVNCILPNGIRTGMMADTSPAFVETILAPQSIKRIGEPSEVGAAVTWLCSDKASFVTGVALPVDGGFLTGS